MKALLREALKETLEGELTEFLGAARGERTERPTVSGPGITLAAE